MLNNSPRSVRNSLCLVVPVYKNEGNIPILITELEKLNSELQGCLTVTFVIDGSPDLSGSMLLDRQKHLTFPSRIVFHSRNFGAFTAIRTGLEFSSGSFYAVMAADLQEPPELVVKMFGILENEEADVVFGVRTSREDGFANRLLSHAFWLFYRKLVIPEIPKGGVDIFACNNEVRDALISIREPNSSLIAQLFWLGFRRAFVSYHRRKRINGKSAWRFTMRIRYMMDSIFSFSDLPILIPLWTGLFGLICSLCFSLFLVISHFLGLISVPGYVTLAVLITLFGSISMAIQGVLGSYLWRTYENSKQRPLRIISRISNEVPIPDVVEIISNTRAVRDGDFAGSIAVPRNF